MRQRIQRLIQEMSTNPRPYLSRKMQSPSDMAVELRRIRLDRWRVVYIIDEEWSEIGILTIRQRPPYDYSDLSDLLKDV